MENPIANGRENPFTATYVRRHDTITTIQVGTLTFTDNNTTIVIIKMVLPICVFLCAPKRTRLDFFGAADTPASFLHCQKRVLFFVVLKIAVGTLVRTLRIYR